MAVLMRLIVMLASLILRLLIKMRLGIPLLYTILMVTVFDGWTAEHNTLAVGILIALVVAVGVSWVVSLFRKVKAI